MDGEFLPQPGWLDFFLIEQMAPRCRALASTSRTAPTLPSGYTYAFMPGAARVNPSGNVLGFLQRGRKTQYIVGGANIANPVSMASGTASAWTAVAVGNFVPPSASSIKVYASGESGASSGALVGIAPNNSYGFEGQTN